MAWTLFWDMHSGGDTKESWEKIYIEASEEEAKLIFYNRFGHNPERVSCTCCGEDYSIYESETLEQASAFHRNCPWIRVTDRAKNSKGKPLINDCKDRYLEGDGKVSGEKIPVGYTIEQRYSSGEWMSLEEYVKSNTVLVIRNDDIAVEERIGKIPEQGYVWQN